MNRNKSYLTILKDVSNDTKLLKDTLKKNNRMALRLKRLAFNRRDLTSSLLHSHYADAHTQHNKKVDRHQNLQNEKNHIS